MKIKCEQCGMVIPSEYIFKKSNMVQCPFCLHESKLSESVVYFGGEDNSYGYKKNLKLPKGMSIKLNRYNLEITYRWFKLEYLFYLLIYGGVGYFWFKGIWGLAGNDIFDSFDIYEIIFHFCSILYGVLGFVLNKTKISASKEKLSIRVVPIYFPFQNHDIPISNIIQMYCKREVIHRKNDTKIYYKVMGIIRGKKDHIELIKNLHEKKQAQFIEYHLEKYLGIKDQKVGSEMSKQ